MKTIWDFARHAFTFCLLCLLYDLGHITKFETDFLRQQGFKN